MNRSFAQHEIFLGLTNTVLLWTAFEYYEIGVNCILCCFLAISGFIKRFKSYWEVSWCLLYVDWLRCCFQFDAEYWDVFKILFSICGILNKSDNTVLKTVEQGYYFIQETVLYIVAV